ncbi:MAG: pinensin family lanthipeptide [Rhodothermaceae bacterium]
MEKLKLNLNELRVESFETRPEANRSGTVVGNAPCTEDHSGCQDNTFQYETCATCNNTCGVTCNGEISCNGTCAWSCVDCGSSPKPTACVATNEEVVCP